MSCSTILKMKLIFHESNIFFHESFMLCRYFSEKRLMILEIAQEGLRSVGNVDIPPPQRDRSPPRESQASTSQEPEFSEEVAQYSDFKLH